MRSTGHPLTICTTSWCRRWPVQRPATTSRWRLGRRHPSTPSPCRHATRHCQLQYHFSRMMTTLIRCTSTTTTSDDLRRLATTTKHRWCRRRCRRSTLPIIFIPASLLISITTSSSINNTQTVTRTCSLYPPNTPVDKVCLVAWPKNKLKWN